MKYENPIVRKLRELGSVSGEERLALESAVSTVTRIPMDRDMVSEGSHPNFSTMLIEGFAARYKHVPSGKRQIVSIHVPGDFVDLHSFLLKRMDHSVVAFTDCRMALVPHERLREITDRFPNLTRLLWLSTLIDAAIHREWLLGMGRRKAFANVAHLVCELYLRLRVMKLTQDFRFDLPLTQQELADTTGLSIVHLNRALQDLRSRHLLTWEAGVVTITDWPGLVRRGEFDPTYLQLNVDELSPA